MSSLSSERATTCLSRVVFNHLRDISLLDIDMTLTGPKISICIIWSGSIMLIHILAPQWCFHWLLLLTCLTYFILLEFQMRQSSHEFSFYKESLILTYKCESFSYFLLEIKHCFFIKDLYLDFSARNMLPIAILDINHQLLPVIPIVVPDDIPFQHSFVHVMKTFVVISKDYCRDIAFLITFDSRVLYSIICL